MINQSLLLAGDDQYQIARSLRFNSADSAYLNRTPASAGNRRTWTWSGWVKRSVLSSYQAIFGAFDGIGNNDGIAFDANDKIQLFSSNGSATFRLTTAVYRDVSAFYHIVVASDTTNATAQNRARIWVNGIEVTVWDTNATITQNLDWNGYNTTNQQNIGRYYTSGGGGGYFNGYLTEVNFIDGQALTPSSFGETDSATGVWKPKKYTGTYGTNGFYLNFSDNSGTTATTLGKDSSGNGNNWTPNNFSVTAGAGNDSLVDTPTPYGTDTGAGGEVRGNYATLNPLQNGGITLTNGNLDGTKSGAGWLTTIATMGMSSGKWYWEGTCTKGSDNQAIIGIVKAGATISNYVGVDANGWCYYTDGTQKLKINNATTATYGATYTTGDVIGVGLDVDGGTLTFYKNGVSQGTAYSSLSGEFFPAISCVNSSAWNMNFGQRPFAYTAPSGYKALCTQNMPTPTIGATASTQAGKYFNAVLWTGDGTDNRSITGVGFQPDFVWVKARSAAESNNVYDAVRGANKAIYTNYTLAEETLTETFESFNTDGFTVSYNSGYSSVFTNKNTTTYVAWNWNAGGSNATNTAGSITSTVRANASAGFSIVTYTGTGANATVGHGLGVAPKMIIVKQRTASSTTNWIVWHTSTAGYSWYLKLNLTDAQNGDTTVFQAAASSTTFSIGSNSAVNANNGTYVAYCFSEVASYSRFGSYSGNGNSDGPFIWCGFRPRFVIVKVTNTTGDWVMWDTARDPYNLSRNVFYPNLSSAEDFSGSRLIDILSNGFKLRGDGTANSNTNTNNNTYVYMAFAESPFKYALAR